MISQHTMTTPFAIEIPNVDDTVPKRRNRRRVVGFIPSHFILTCRKKKKHSKSIEIRDVGLDTIHAALAFYQHGGEIGCRTMHEVVDMYKLAKILGSDDLIQACVRCAWTLRDTWIHVDIGERDREEEDTWMYDTIINHTYANDVVEGDETEVEIHNSLLDESGGGDDVD